MDALAPPPSLLPGPEPAAPGLTPWLLGGVAVVAAALVAALVGTYAALGRGQRGGKGKGGSGMAVALGVPAGFGLLVGAVLYATALYALRDDARAQMRAVLLAAGLVLPFALVGAAVSATSVAAARDARAASA
jgi:heme/copper-type cytochrome/quinol oxidase subunit 3